MPNIKTITLPSGTTYDLVDQGARDLIDALQQYTDYLGVTTTALTDGATTNPIVIDGQSVTAVKGNIANYQSKEFIFNGTAWQEFGDLSGLGDLAYKDSASGNFTPSGSVSQPTFSGNEMTATGTFTPSGTISTGTGTANYTPSGTVTQPIFTGEETTSTGTFTPSGTISKGTGTANYTPQGSVSTPDITVTPNTGTVNSITSVGTLPTLTTTVQNENLTIGWSAGTLPTKGEDTSVVTGIASATSTQPTFTGTGAELKFTGASGNVSVKGTPSGTVSQPTFNGTGTELKFTGTAGSVSAKGTPSGTVTKPTFTGTQGTVTVS